MNENNNVGTCGFGFLCLLLAQLFSAQPQHKPHSQSQPNPTFSVQLINIKIFDYPSSFLGSAMVVAVPTMMPCLFFIALFNAATATDPTDGFFFHYYFSILLLGLFITITYYYLIYSLITNHLINAYSLHNLFLLNQITLLCFMQLLL